MRRWERLAAETGYHHTIPPATLPCPVPDLLPILSYPILSCPVLSPAQAQAQSRPVLALKLASDGPASPFAFSPFILSHTHISKPHTQDPSRSRLSRCARISRRVRASEVRASDKTVTTAIPGPCFESCCPALPCFALPCLALPCPALPCLALSCPASAWSGLLVTPRAGGSSTSVCPGVRAWAGFGRQSAQCSSPRTEAAASGNCDCLRLRLRPPATQQRTTKSSQCS